MTVPVAESVEEFQDEVIRAVIVAFEESEYDRVDIAYFDGEGTFVLEGHLRWASRDRQEDTH